MLCNASPDGGSSSLHLSSAAFVLAFAVLAPVAEGRDAATLLDPRTTGCMDKEALKLPRLDDRRLRLLRSSPPRMAATWETVSCI